MIKNLASIADRKDLIKKDYCKDRSICKDTEEKACLSRCSITLLLL